MRSEGGVSDGGWRSGVPERFSLVETMLWDGGYPLMDLHLDRLMDSAEYFGIRVRAGRCENGACRMRARI